jgi:hypothetical protein
MRDDFESRFWAENHHQLSNGIGQLIDKAGYAFRRLVAFQYDAPWQRAEKQRVERCG